MSMPKKTKSTPKRRVTAKKRRTTRKKVERISPRESFLTTGPVIEVCEEHRLASADLDMDHGLWGRAKTQWLLGDWESLAALDLAQLEHDPRRAELATLSACAHLQRGEKQSARQCLAAASRWKCSPAFMVRALVASSEASLSRYHRMSGREDKATALLASSASAFGGDGALAARLERELHLYNKTQRHSDRGISVASHTLPKAADARARYSRPDTPAATLLTKAAEKTLQQYSVNYTSPFQVHRIFQILIVDEGHTPTAMSSAVLRNTQALKELHPSAEYHLFDNNQLRAFLALNFHPLILNAYEALKPYAYKADLARYCLLYFYGGLYVDLGISVVSRYEIPQHRGITCFREPIESCGALGGICNGLLYARPRRPEFKHAILQIVSNCSTRFYGHNSLCPTGPVLFGQAVLLANKLDEIDCGQSYLSPEMLASFRNPQGIEIAQHTKRGGTDNDSWGLLCTNNYNRLWTSRQVYELNLASRPTSSTATTSSFVNCRVLQLA
jgi:hypothetical protein